MGYVIKSGDDVIATATASGGGNAHFAGTKVEADGAAYIVWEVDGEHVAQASKTGACPMQP